jgi:hypothetical protein
METNNYENTLADFFSGERVEFHPATDLWMRGCRFGRVASVGRKYVRVATDHGTYVKVTPDLLRVVWRCGSARASR